MMHLEQIFLDNPGRNFNYLVACPRTQKALAIDPLDADKVLALAKHKGYQITHIINTHEHPDHTGGNEQVMQETGAVLLASEKAKTMIPHVHQGLKGGDSITIGDTIRFKVLDTPGHTMAHICLFADTITPPVLICGDTLFNAGAGNCYNGGDPRALYQTFATIISALPDDSRVYPGHDYIMNNLRFALDREPDNLKAKALLEKLSQSYDPNDPYVTTIEQEKEINPFLRLHSSSIRKKLHEEKVIESEDVSDETIFLALRELRNRW